MACWLAMTSANLGSYPMALAVPYFCCHLGPLGHPQLQAPQQAQRCYVHQVPISAVNVLMGMLCSTTTAMILFFSHAILGTSTWQSFECKWYIQWKRHVFYKVLFCDFSQGLFGSYYGPSGIRLTYSDNRIFTYGNISESSVGEGTKFTTQILKLTQGEGIAQIKVGGFGASYAVFLVERYVYCNIELIDYWMVVQHNDA